MDVTKKHPNAMTLNPLIRVGNFVLLRSGYYYHYPISTSYSGTYIDFKEIALIVSESDAHVHLPGLFGDGHSYPFVVFMLGPEPRMLVPHETQLESIRCDGQRWR